jgi:UDP-N-acetylmuramoylalanine--D-glutamate ligase
MARFLLSRGADVAGYDENGEALAARPVQTLQRNGMRLAHDPGFGPVDWAVVSPGISEEHPVVRRLRNQGVPVADELDLASQWLPGTLVGVTGTNGKSTTTVLIARMLEAAGRRVFCGGNLAPGQPMSEALALPARDYYVAEVSSFQLERARWFRPRVAVVLNLTPDHLNRHGSMARYAACKLRILDRQTTDDFAVLNYDDDLVRRSRGRGQGERFFFSLRRRVRGAYAVRGRLWFRGEPLIHERRMALPGRHNIQNGLAAAAVARLLGVRTAAVRKVLTTFPGLEHRLELVATIDGVKYVNNSMCTNPAAGARSLEALAGEPERAPRDRAVVLIAGGREKDLPFDEYVDAMTRYARWVVLTGENRERLARALGSRGFGRFDVAPDLRSAVAAGRAGAGRGGTVLFAPGFASFDQFADFRARGEAFRKAVGRLAKARQKAVNRD